MPIDLDTEKWNRKELFYFFKDYDTPFFNICAEVEVTDLLAYTKENQISFFIASLYLSLKSANMIEAFRYRIRGEKVIIHDVIHAGSTVLNSDQTFSFCYFDYCPSFQPFNQEASKKLARHAEGFKSLEPEEHRDDLIHYSVIPWISFTSFSHARKHKTQDSVPKIVFGKYFDSLGIKKLPVSVEVHHALMDGIHVAKFFETCQNLLNNPQEFLK